MIKLIKLIINKIKHYFIVRKISKEAKHRYKTITKEQQEKLEKLQFAMENIELFDFDVVNKNIIFTKKNQSGNSVHKVKWVKILESGEWCDIF